MGNLVGPAGNLADMHAHTQERACGMLGNRVGSRLVADPGRARVAWAEPPILLIATES